MHKSIRYGVFTHSLGRMILAVDEVGLCFLNCGEWHDAEDTLRKYFPHAHYTRDEAGLQGWFTRVCSVIEGKTSASTLAFSLQGTPFQRQVWDALLRIPYGTTLTYGQLAERIGRPAASRAVGAACGANPVALCIPCHRVVASNGALQGFAWGLDMKERLLAYEASQMRTAA